MIILASNDVYHPKDGCEWTENFNWDIQGNNLFDQKCKCFIEENKPLTISEIHFTDYNDLSVLLSDRFLLSTFIDNSFGGESWRILDNVNRKHFVCTEGHVEVL